jgi:hypothetical protein
MVWLMWFYSLFDLLRNLFKRQNKHVQQPPLSSSSEEDENDYNDDDDSGESTEEYKEEHEVPSVRPGSPACEIKRTSH